MISTRICSCKLRLYRQCFLAPALSQPSQYAARRKFSDQKPNDPSPSAKPDSPTSSTTSSSTHKQSSQEQGVSFNTTAVAIPGPAWLWTPLKPLIYPLNVYNRAQNKRPYLTQFITSLIIYFLGDLSSQMIQQPAPSVDPTPPISQAPETQASTLPKQTPTAWEHYDPARSLRALIIGGIFSLPSYHWFLYLSSLFPHLSHIPRLTCQVLLNQIAFAPVFNSYFFSMQSLLSFQSPKRSGGDSSEDEGFSLDIEERLEDAWQRIKTTVPTSWYNSCKFWPAVTAFSFTFVQPRSRSVFAGCVAIGWQTYLGLVNQRAVAGEKAGVDG